MKLIDKQDFSISNEGELSNDLLNLLVASIVITQEGDRAIIELEDGNKVWITSKNPVAAQCLRKITSFVGKYHVGKKGLKEIIEKEFCLAERIG